MRSTAFKLCYNRDAETIRFFYTKFYPMKLSIITLVNHIWLSVCSDEVFKDSNKWKHASLGRYKMAVLGLWTSWRDVLMSCHPNGLIRLERNVSRGIELMAWKTSSEKTLTCSLSRIMNIKSITTDWLR